MINRSEGGDLVRVLFIGRDSLEPKRCAENDLSVARVPLLTAETFAQCPRGCAIRLR